MESLSFFELKNFSQWLQPEMEGAQLQDLWTNGQLLIFQFYKYKEIFLLVDTNPQKPLIVYSEKAPRIEKKQKPLVLFLNSHGKNLRWQNMEVNWEKGRVLEILLAGGERSCRIEIQLIPKAFNLIVEADEKRVAWEKPRELPASSVPILHHDVEMDWAAFGQEWLQKKFSAQPNQNSKRSEAAGEDPRPRALEKKKKALAAIEQQLQDDPSARWKQLGEALKISETVPVELQDLYNNQKNRSWNLENSFSQAKHLEKKRAGTEDRRDKLKVEIAKLTEDIQKNPNAVPVNTNQPKASRLLEKTNSRGRRLQMDDGLEAVMGKSAADNLAILRQARAWDLWLHLKDYPGSHAIILRPKQKEVPQNVIRKVSEWLIRESLSSQKIQWGAKYDVVVVECRHVRPIKGDRLGRVTYHYPQVYSFASKT